MDHARANFDNYGAGVSEVLALYGGTWSAGGPTANLSALQAVAVARGR